MRWLAIAMDENGEQKAAIVNDTTGSVLPHGDHAAIIERLDGCDSLNALISLPDGDFRPDIIDAGTDEEVAVVFIDL